MTGKQILIGTLILGGVSAIIYFGFFHNKGTAAAKNRAPDDADGAEGKIPVTSEVNKVTGVGRTFIKPK